MADNDLLLAIDVESALDQLLGKLEDFAADQLPYATAGAFFGVALDARAEMTRQLHRKFTIRTGEKPWAARAMHVHPKSAGLIKKNITSGQGASVTIASNDEMGRLLTEGGTKKGAAGKNLAVPVLGGARKNKMTITRTNRNYPGDYLKTKTGKKAGFIIPTKNGGSIIFTRQKKYVRGEDDRDKLQAMYILKPEVQIKPWWDVRKVLADAMQQCFPKRFEEACKKAMETRWK